MTATVAGIHLGLDTHANRPAGNAVPDGSFYSCSTHSLIYKSNFAGNSWATWATLGGGTTPAKTRYIRSSGNYTTTSTSLVDVDGTNFALSITTGANPVLIGFAGTVRCSGAFTVVLDLMVDGTSETGGVGIIAKNFAASGSPSDMSFVWMSNTLTAGSHTFKLRWLTTAGTATMEGGTGGGYMQAQMWVAEIA